MRVIGVIPARYQSSRFPGKPLALIAGKMLVQRVWEQAKKAKELNDVIIATDDERIQKASESFGARVVMTPVDCNSGTDRLAVVARFAETRAGCFVNIQGDEPLIPPKLIDALVQAMKNDCKASVVTACFPLENSLADNPNVSKVALDENGYALLFSRSPIPYARTKFHSGYLKHLGIYAYRRKPLLQFSKWMQTTLEIAESLEQLRFLEKGYKIKVIASDEDSFGVDVPEDVKKIEELLRQNEK